MCGCLLSNPHWGPGPQPKHVPGLGIKPATLWFAGRHSVHWATPARAGLAKFINVSTVILLLDHDLCVLQANFWMQAWLPRGETSLGVWIEDVSLSKFTTKFKTIHTSINDGSLDFYRISSISFEGLCIMCKIVDLVTSRKFSNNLSIKWTVFHFVKNCMLDVVFLYMVSTMNNIHA